jgi:predicted  nucleic acid-binding Zn-ribbon protein
MRWLARPWRLRDSGYSGDSAWRQTGTTVMATMNLEAEVKALRTRADALERKVDSLEKILRALPDLAVISKFGPRLDAAEKAIAGKKDAKTAEQEASKAEQETKKSIAKLVADMQDLNKEMMAKAMLDARFKVLESQVAVAMAVAGKR